MTIFFIFLFIAFIMILLHYNILFIIFLLIALLYLFVVYHNLISKHSKDKQYILSKNTISNKYLKYTIKSGLINGKIIIPKKIVRNIIENKYALQKKEVLNNLIYIKKYCDYDEINIESNIASLCKYAFDNNAILIIDNENISDNLLKIFNIDIIDLKHLNISNSHIINKGEKIKFILIDDTNGEACIINDYRVKLRDCGKYNKNTIYESEVKSFIEIDNKKYFIIEENDEE